MKRNPSERYFLSSLAALFLSAAMAFSLSFVSAASARPFRLGILPDQGKGFTCATCHSDPRGGGKRNGFGEDYGRIGIKAGEKYTPDLGQVDSDGDGFTNDQEFAASTNPGDPKSKP